MKSRFTLVELLVVIAIISVLAAMLYPALSAARVSSVRAACCSNQEQTYRAIAQGMQANDGFLVSGEEFKNDDANNLSWASYLLVSGVISDVKAMRCPTFLYNNEWGKPLIDGNSKARDALEHVYGVQFCGTPSATHGRQGIDFRSNKYLVCAVDTETVVTLSPSLLMIGGCTAKKAGADKYWDSYGVADFTSNGKGRAAAAHSGSCNIFHLDGHVATRNKEEFKESYAPDPNTPGAIKASSGNFVEQIDSQNGTD